MRRRSFVGRLGAVAASIPVLASVFPRSARAEGAPKPTLRVMMKRACGSDDPTKAAFPFLHGLALAEAGHEVQIRRSGAPGLAARRSSWGSSSGRTA